MAITVEAIYENGVFKPLEPLALNEHERVQLTVETNEPGSRKPKASWASQAPKRTPITLPWTRISHSLHRRRNDDFCRLGAR